MYKINSYNISRQQLYMTQQCALRYCIECENNKVLQICLKIKKQKYLPLIEKSSDIHFSFFGKLLQLGLSN